jgi:double-stranded uracil-DNA glycosylase
MGNGSETSPYGNRGMEPSADEGLSPGDGLADLLAPGLRLLFVGYNPSVRAALVGHYYAGRNNRFWDLLAESGLTTERLDFTRDDTLPARGIGLTDLVKRPTRAAAQLTRAELRAGAARLCAMLSIWRPRVVCYNGKGVYLHAAGRRQAAWGRQPTSLVDGCVDFVAPSPSGLAAIPFAEKTAWYVRLRQTMEEMDR